jgi:hypothetical protein
MASSVDPNFLHLPRKLVSAISIAVSPTFENTRILLLSFEPCGLVGPCKPCGP